MQFWWLFFALSADGVLLGRGFAGTLAGIDE